MMNCSTFTIEPPLEPSIRRPVRALLALNLAYAVLVVLERVLHKLGVDALHFVWPRLSPSLGDVLQAGLLLGGLLLGLAALRRHRSIALGLLSAVVAVLLLMQTLHPHLHLAPEPVPAVSAALFPDLNAAQGQKLLMGTTFWLVLFGLTLLAVASSTTSAERRAAKSFLAAFCLIGLAGGLGDYLGTVFNYVVPGAGTVFELLEEGGELAGASLLFMIMLRFDRSR